MDHHENVLLSNITKVEPESSVLVLEESSAKVLEELGNQATGGVSYVYEESSADESRIKSTIKLKQVHTPSNEDVIPDNQQNESSSVSPKLTNMVHWSGQEAKQNKSFGKTNKIDTKLRFESTINLEELPSPVLTPTSDGEAGGNKIINESTIQLENVPSPTPTPGSKKHFESTNHLELVTLTVSTAGNDEASSVYDIGEGQTPGVEISTRSTNATPGGEASSEISDHGADDTSEELLADKYGDCDLLYPYRILLTLCTLSLLALLVLCFIFYPKPVELCLKLSLDDEEIVEKVLDDEGNYKLNLTNPNSIDVDIHGLEISAYYGGVAEENWLLNAEKMDYHIPAHSTLTSDHTYTFTQDCTAAVPLTTLNGCIKGYRTHIAFEIVTSFKACLLSFVCHEGIVSKSHYKSYCPEDEMVCTELGFFLV